MASTDVTQVSVQQVVPLLAVRSMDASLHFYVDALARIGLGISLNFICRDALAFYHIVKDRGVAIKRPFVGNRMWVTSLKDPDGYDLHFESPTTVPEETQYDG